MTVSDGLLEATVVGSFSRIGFALRSRHHEPLPKMDGKTVLVTGGSSGIGLAAARTLGALGAHVVVVGRDQDRLDRATAALAEEGSGDVAAAQADLSLLAEVRRLAERLAGIGPIDVLVNNVSILSREHRVTGEGIELTLATNLLGPFLLTNLLVPQLAAAAAGRVVTVSSGGMYTQPLDVAALEAGPDGYRGAVAYARTKRAQVSLTELWAKRLRPVGIVAHAMHPGWVDTPGLRSSLPVFHRMVRPVLRSPEQGADTVAFLAAATAPGETSGLFWHDRRPRPTHRIGGAAAGPEQAQQLWSFLGARSGWVEPEGWPR